MPSRVVNVLLEFTGLTLIFLIAGLIIAFAFGGF
jgi:hypothetical protein